MRHDTIVISKSTKELTLTHPAMKVTINKADGRWSAHDRSTNTLKVRDAAFDVDKHGEKRWRPAPVAIRTTTRTVTTCFGQGTRATVRFTPKSGYEPERRLHITLYPDRSFLELGWSMRNPHAYEIRVRDVDLIHAAHWLPEHTMTSPRVLRGGAGGDANTVERGWRIEARNSMLLTYRDQGVRQSMVAGGLRYREYARHVEMLPGTYRWGNGPEPALDESQPPCLTLRAWDPQGKRVAPGATYHSEDSAYIDFVTADPFDSLEAYGQAMRLANEASPNTYDFPTLCGWMVSTRHLGEGKPINHSAGLVEQTELAAAQGLMKYTPLAVRLEPDAYCYPDHGNTQQGWWDDEHFRKYGSLTPPYGSFRSFCQAVQERGGIPLTYVQTSMPSNDFALAHPDWMLNNDISELHRPHAHHKPHVRYDFTDPGFQKHIKSVWRRLKRAGLRGVKFDYPETGWARNGGFEDPTHTTTSAYRTIYALCKSGLGEDSYVHERILGNPVHDGVPCLDVTAGLVDLQRVWGDASHFEPEMASRMGLRWYKSRSVFLYYPDGKSFYREGKALPDHERRAFLTLLAFLSGRIEIGTSIGSMTEAMIHDLTRVYPVFPGTRSPRPVDMLTDKPHPEVYAYAVTPDWHQVLLVNNGSRKRTIATPIAASSAEEGGLELDPNTSYHAFDFWDQRYLGKHTGTDHLEAPLRGGQVAMISLRRVASVPQAISTNRHIMQGMVECHDLRWSDKKRAFTGSVDVIGGEPFTLTLARNGTPLRHIKTRTGQARILTRPESDDLIDIVFNCPTNQRVRFTVS